MWIFTATGFYSIVKREPRSQVVTIRTRRERDLEIIRQEIPELSQTYRTSGGTLFEADAPATAVARWLSKQVCQVNYSNLETSVEVTSGEREAVIYRDIFKHTRRFA